MATHSLSPSVRIGYKMAVTSNKGTAMRSFTIPTKQQAAKGGRGLFWAWIAYQTVKGSLTTCFIWVPMIYYYVTR